MYVTRLSWNSNGWQSPSGRTNKCCGTDAPLYECLAGFGWEEWLFKKEHRLSIPPYNEEFQYGFLQCFNSSIPMEEIVYKDVYLTSRKCDGACNPANTGTYYAIGKIKLVTRLGVNESRNVNTYFEQNGLIANMRNECLDVDGIDMDRFDEGPGNPDNPQTYMNVKFRVEDVDFFEKRIKIPSVPKRFRMVAINLKSETHQKFLKSIGY
ncbi:hypothetical protein [Emticicia fontis]